MASTISDPPASTSAWQTPGFKPFLIARMLGVFAQQIQAVVVAWQVYSITRDTMSLAYVGLAQFVPMLLLLIPAGELSDRMSRKRLLMLSWAGTSVCALALWLLSLLSLRAEPTVDWIYAVLVLFGVCRAFTGPALQSLLPQVVPREQLAQALATNSMLMRTAAIVAPVLGGSLYALGGGVLTYGCCVLALLLSLAAMAGVPVRYGQQSAPAGAASASASASASAWTRFTEGIRFIRRSPVILGTISLDLFAVLLGGVVALLPVYAHEVLQVGPAGLGLLRSSMAVGEVAMGLWLSLYPFRRHTGRKMLLAVALFGLANLVFALSHWFWISAAALAVAGAADMVSVYIRSAMVQFATPDHMRGRVNAVNMLFISSSNELGEFRTGSSAAWFGAVPAAVGGALCTLGIVGLWTWRFPGLRQVDQLEDAASLTSLTAASAAPAGPAQQRS